MQDKQSGIVKLRNRMAIRKEQIFRISADAVLIISRVKTENVAATSVKFREIYVRNMN